MKLAAHHDYQSAADRANDAVLITEVKGALADDGVAKDCPMVWSIAITAKILLSGVMKSAERRKARAGNIAASAEPGVVAVKNQLSWH